MNWWHDSHHPSFTYISFPHLTTFHKSKLAAFPLYASCRINQSTKCCDVFYVCIAAVDKETFGKDYTDNKIASDIAPYWDNVGIYLGVKRLSNIKDNNSPTEYKFKGVLRKWLKQEGSKDEIYKKFHEALKGVELVAAAEKFYKIAQEITDDDDDDDDMDHAVPN